MLSEFVAPHNEDLAFLLLRLLDVQSRKKNCHTSNIHNRTCMKVLAFDSVVNTF